MAFKHRISFATYLAANFGCNWFRIIPDIVSSIYTQPSEVAVLFNSNLSRRHFLRQVLFHLLPIRLQTLVAIYSESRLTSFPSFCAPPSEVAVLLDLNLSRRPFLRHVVDFSQIPSKISIQMTWKNISFHKWLVAARRARYLQSIKTFLTVELKQYRKSGSTFSSRELVTARSDCCRLGNTLCLCSPVQTAQAVLERCSKSLAIDFAVKSFDCLLEWSSGVIARRPALVGRGLNLDSNLNSASSPMGCRGFICSETPK